ncbi:MAG: BON domain-containing protein [Cardiobacteriaceae bacterium]|nr:BON domain-containing protein [Cardiobacteriaceae bacterium]
MQKIFLSLSIALLAASLNGCAPVVLGGAAAGVSVANDRRSAGTVIDDKTLQLNVSNRLRSEFNIKQNSHIVVTAYNGAVLLTGEAADTNVKQQAEYVAGSVSGVQRVFNHIAIGPRSSLAHRGYDTKQTAKVKTALLDVAIPGFNPHRVKVVTEHGVTYLMGIVSENEANAAVSVAQKVSGVVRVVSLFEINNQIGN